MSKIQTIIILFVFLIVLFSMDMIFGNPLRETFRANGRIGTPQVLGSKLDYRPTIRQNTMNGNMGYSGLPIANVPPHYVIQSDDQPLHFGFSF
jgi:hypothetical protein